MHLIESNLYVIGLVTIIQKTVTQNGGGIYLSQSEINCQQGSTLHILNNTAEQEGGGVYAFGSSLKTASTQYISQQY